MRQYQIQAYKDEHGDLGVELGEVVYKSPSQLWKAISQLYDVGQALDRQGPALVRHQDGNVETVSEALDRGLTITQLPGPPTSPWKERMRKAQNDGLRLGKKPSPRAKGQAPSSKRQARGPKLTLDDLGL